MNIRFRDAFQSERLRTGVLVLLAAWSLNCVLQGLGFYDRYDAADFDHYSAAMPEDPEWSSRITIIDINDDSYKTLFAQASPLDPAKTMKIIQAVLDYRPAPDGQWLVSRSTTSRAGR